MAFMLGKNLVFIDSFQFMSSSLASLANNLPKGLFQILVRRVPRRKAQVNDKEGDISI